MIGQSVAVQASQRSSHVPLDWRSIARGSVVGFAASVVVFGLIEALRHRLHGFAGSGAETVVSLLALVCYIVGGFYAVGSKGVSARTTGALAGIGVACLGIVVSLAMWAAASDGPRFTGRRAELGLTRFDGHPRSGV